MASRRDYPDPIRKLFSESPLVRAVVDEAMRRGSLGGLIDVLETRFGIVPPATIALLRDVRKIDELLDLSAHAAVCDSPQSFEAAILGKSLRPTPSKRRAKRRSI